jgi:N-acyl-D-amino-acid deacylase
MHDLVIRNAKVIDGTGAAFKIVDVAVEGGLIVAVEANARAGHREIDAGGDLLTPGFVDIHTHYDGQVCWDKQVTPSSGHGVTSVVMGNCGVGFAPIRPAHGEAWVPAMLCITQLLGR